MRPSSLPTAAAALRLLKAVLLLALALGLLRPAAVVAQSDRATVRVDGRPVFRVGGADSSDAAERALRIENRLGILLENPRAIGPARVERTAGRDLAVSVSGVSVVTVTPADAEDNVTSLEDLAVQWARAIDAALASARERRLSRFGRFGAEVRGAVTAAFSRLAESAIRIVPRALAALLVLALFWLLAAGARRLMRFVFRSAAQGAEGVLEEPPVSVRLRELGASDLVLEVRFWADSRRSDLVATQSNVRAALLEAFRQAGIGLPEPDLRRVRIEVPPNSDAGREKGG